MLSFWVSFFCVGIFVATAAYLIARKVKLMAIVDTIWTAGLGISALVYHTVLGLESIRSWAVLLVIFLWSFRLSFHLYRDRVFSGHDDPRYKALAEHWGARSARNFYFLFLAQIVFIALFLFPVSIAMQNPQPLWAWTDTMAVLIGISAMLGEWIADRQLANFRANPKNKGGVCKDRLWRYSRHPNYFFEWLHWFAYPAFSMGSSLVGFALVGPIAMFIFLRFLTGVPYAEMSSLKSRGEAYRQYQSSTNAFFPWIPRDKTA